MSSRRDSVGSTSSAAYSMTLSVPPTAAASRRSSLFFAAVGLGGGSPSPSPSSGIAHDAAGGAGAASGPGEDDLLPPHCHEMLCEDSECLLTADGGVDAADSP